MCVVKKVAEIGTKRCFLKEHERTDLSQEIPKREGIVPGTTLQAEAEGCPQGTALGTRGGLVLD